MVLTVILCVCLWNSDTLFICTVIELKDETPAWITVTDTEFCTEPHQTCTFICIITQSIQMTSGVWISPH